MGSSANKDHTKSFSCKLDWKLLYFQEQFKNIAVMKISILCAVYIYIYIYIIIYTIYIYIYIYTCWYTECYLEDLPIAMDEWWVSHGNPC